MLQVGFGWTNGVVLDFLNMYGDRLRAEEKEEGQEPKKQEVVVVERSDGENSDVSLEDREP